MTLIPHMRHGTLNLLLFPGGERNTVVDLLQLLQAIRSKRNSEPSTELDLLLSLVQVPCLRLVRC